MRIASFDIGKLNFAFCVEEVEEKNLNKINNIPLSKRYNPDGTCTREMNEILEEVYSNGKIILYKNLNITQNCENKKFDPLLYINMYNRLDDYRYIWNSCDYFVIEEQMSFGKKLNKCAMKLGQHCYSYFIFNYGINKKVIEFPAYHKTHILGAPKVEGKPYKSGKIRYKAMEKPQRKKWSVDKTIEILTHRGETETLDLLTSAKRKDDLADTFTQLQAFKYKLFIEKTI